MPMPTDVTALARQTIKQQILDALVVKLEQAFLENTGSGSDEKLFEFVEVRDGDDWSPRSTPACGIEYGVEETADLMSGRIDKVFRVFFEVRLRQIKGVDPYKVFNYYAGRVIEVCLSDIKLGGLTRDIQEAGSNPQINGLDDPLPGGSVFVDVKYRHINGNPFERG